MLLDNAGLLRRVTACQAPDDYAAPTEYGVSYIDMPRCITMQDLASFRSAYITKCIAQCARYSGILGMWDESTEYRALVVQRVSNYS